MKFSDTIKKFSELSAAVVGDIMLDRYFLGDIERVSPESPAPVVLLREEKCIPGGAANTAVNIAYLGAHALLFGRVGKDNAADIIAALLSSAAIGAKGVLASQLPTTEKNRIVAKGQQIVRLDREDVSYWGDQQEQVFCRRIESMGKADVIIVSDYAKGVITPRVAETILNLGHKKGIPVVVDVKPKHAELFRGAAVFAPNKKEAEEMAGILIRDEKTLEKAGKILQSKLQANILITRGAAGMTLFAGDHMRHFPSAAREVYDVTGAGDTVTAVFALALAAHCSPEDSAILATHAAGIAVGKRGTAAVSIQELSHAVDANEI
ncbi:MAG: bifunctional hydroxymethylpyrimidine kinase/phosphomethylpyrimidine kinase [Candidatus Sungbacteria bacterium]|nr:bifunctional hydroxymethylpyrimidine kinase/phosphomethylpyrimidine kinase [Candidatus Sungbacteria bacterium]